MYFQENLNNMLRDNSNIVNKMYVHELNIKWAHFQELAVMEGSVENSQIIDALNIFRKALSIKKYQYNYRTKNGFRSDSPLFSAKYLDDAINILLKKQSIIKKKGVLWGYEKFSTDIKFSPKSFMDIDNNSMFISNYSSPLLMLSQKIDFQYRLHGKRNFYKYELILPLIIFSTTKVINADSLNKIEIQAKKAKKTFEKTKVILVGETLDKNFQPSMSNSLVDAIFILQKSFSDSYSELQLDVFDSLEQKISDFINEKKTNIERYLEKGIIE